MVPSDLDRERLRELSRRSDVRGLLQLAAHLALLAATTALITLSRGSLWLIPAILAQGIVLSFLFCALHESVHRTAFASRSLNDGVAFISGALLMLPSAYFRLFHFAHHRYTQDPERDPELAQAPARSLAGYLRRVSGLPYWWDRLSVTLRHALTGEVRERFVPPEKRASVVREARVLWGLYLGVAIVSVYFRRADALLYWVLPALVGQPFLRLFLMAEHAGCPLVADMRANTRTTRTNAAVRLLTWRMSYHAEHHSFPAVPFHALARLNALVGEGMQVRARGYLALHRQLLGELRGRRAAG